MKYKICTVANDSYLEFLNYFTKSALETCKNMDQLHILYTGSNFKHDSIYDDCRVKLVRHENVIPTQKIWDSGWTKNVNLKSQFLRDLAINEIDPIFLVDVDCYFIKEFIDVIDTTKDIAITKRNYNTQYIASFVGLIKPKNCISFIDVWREQMDVIQNPPKETKALCAAVSLMNKKLNIQEIPETTVSCINIIPMAPDARILHFKGNSVGEVDGMLKKRINSLKSIL